MLGTVACDDQKAEFVITFMYDMKMSVHFYTEANLALVISDCGEIK
jgi:hypothetical protein